MSASSLSAVAMYVFVATAARVLDDQSFALLNVWTGLLAFIAIVALSPLETLAPKVVGFGDRHGISRLNSRRDMATLAAFCLGVAIVVIVIAGYPLSVVLLDGNINVLLVMPIALGAYALQSIQKGLAVAEIQTRRLVLMQAAFAATLAIALFVIWSAPRFHFATFFIAALVASVFVSVVVGWLAGCALAMPRLPLSGSTPLFRDGASLSVAAAAAHVLTIAPIPILAYLAPSDAVGISVLAGTLLICRSPTILMGSVNGLLITYLTQHVLRGNRKKALKNTLLVAGLVGLVGLLLGVALMVLGNVFLHLLIGAQYSGSASLFFWEMGVVALMCAASVLRLGVLTLGVSGLGNPIWVAAILGFVGVLFVPGDPMIRIVSAQVVSGFIALVGLFSLLVFVGRNHAVGNESY